MDLICHDVIKIFSDMLFDIVRARYYFLPMQMSFHLHGSWLVLITTLFRLTLVLS